LSLYELVAKLISLKIREIKFFECLENTQAAVENKERGGQLLTDLLYQMPRLRFRVITDTNMIYCFVLFSKFYKPASLNEVIKEFSCNIEIFSAVSGGYLFLLSQIFIFIFRINIRFIF
jgi:hypothetical protein